MPKLIRRSILRLPGNTIPVPEWILKIGSDALVLNLENLPKTKREELCPNLVKEAIALVKQSGAEFFIRVNRRTIDEDLELTIWPDLAGIVLPRVESNREVKQLHYKLTEFEKTRNISDGFIQIDAEIGTSLGVINSLDIARSNNRVVALTVAETSLYKDLSIHPEPQSDTDPLEFIKGRIIANACAASIQAQGMSYPLGITLEKADDLSLLHAIQVARNMGFKGAVCPHQSWVQICNDGFRPNAEELSYYKKVVEVFEEGTRQGLASVPLDGRMIDTPVYKRAQVFMEWDKACLNRDLKKVLR